MSHNNSDIVPYQELIFIVHCEHNSQLSNVSQLWCRQCETLKQKSPFAMITVSVNEHGLPEVTVLYNPEWKIEGENG